MTPSALVRSATSALAEFLLHLPRLFLPREVGGYVSYGWTNIHKTFEEAGLVTRHSRLDFGGDVGLHVPLLCAMYTLGKLLQEAAI